jgi:hypothetical protein
MGHSFKVSMIRQYIRALLRKTLEPMGALAETGVALLALAIPAGAFFIGAKRMPGSDNIFAYIGFVFVAVALLRLFFIAPYQLWREQTGQIGSLRLELSEPERREIAHMASIRAEKRLELAAELRQFQWLSFILIDGDNKQALNDAYGRLLALMGQSGVPESFDKIFGRFTSACSKMNRARKAGDDEAGAGSNSFDYIEDMTAYLHGRLTAEQLASKFAKYPDEPELPFEPPAAPPIGKDK